MSSFTWPPLVTSGGVPTYSTFAAFPVSAPNGTLALALDTDKLYAYNTTSMTWVIIGGPGTVLSVGSPANGLSITANVLSLGLASTSNTGALSNTDWNTFNNKQNALTFGNLTDAGTDGITVTNGTGAVIGTGTSLSQHVADTTHNGYLSSTDWNTFNGKQPAGSYITALTGDVTASGPGSAAATLTATTNSTITTLSGLTTASALASVGTITSGTWNGTTIAIAHGGTGQTTASNAFIALSPLTTAGDIIFENNTPTPARLGIGTTGQVLTVVAGLPSWQTPATTGTVTSVSVVSANGFAGTVATATTTPAITLSTTVTGILFGNGTSVATAVAGNFPTLNQNTTGTAANITATSNSTLTTLSALSLPTSQLSGTISLTTQVSGVLPIANGGTNNGTLPVTAGGSIYTDGTALQNTGAGTSGQVLTSNGASAPTWQNNSASIGSLTTYTPTTAGFGTITGATFSYVTIGSSLLRIFGTFVTGTTSLTMASVSLPGTYTINAALPAAQASLVGKANNGTLGGSGLTVWVQGGSSILNFGVDAGTPGALSAATGLQLAGNGVVFSFFCDIPI